MTSMKDLRPSGVQHLGQKLVQWHFKDVESRSSCVALRWTCCLGRTWVLIAAIMNVQMNCMDLQWQKMQFSHLGPIRCHCYLKGGKPRLKLLPHTVGGRIWTWFSACLGNAHTAGWHCHPPCQGTTSDWHVDSLRRERLPSILPTLGICVLQNWPFWVLFLGAWFAADVAERACAPCRAAPGRTTPVAPLWRPRLHAGGWVQAPRCKDLLLHSELHVIGTKLF